MNHYTLFYNVSLISKKFSLNFDIKTLIIHFILNKYSQIIINQWYNYIFIHNINLCNHIISIPIHTYINYNPFSIVKFYDCNSNYLLFVIKLCIKHFRFNISYNSWWLSFLTYVFNGIFLTIPPYSYNFFSIKYYITILFDKIYFHY